jgi:hypothetical protein
LPDAAPTGDFAYAQRAELAFIAVQRDAHGAQQTFVKTGGVKSVMIVQRIASGSCDGQIFLSRCDPIAEKR